MQQGKSIGNVNILDLRSATEASIAEIHEIGNVNVAITTKNTAYLFQRLKIGNVNTIVEIPDKVNFYQSFGRIVMGKEFFDQLEVPTYVLGFGQTIILPDVTTEEITDKLAGLSVFGQLIASAPIKGLLQARGAKVFGETESYIPLASFHLGSLTLDVADLELMQDSSELTVIGSLEVPKALPGGLFAQKITKLSVTGKILCHAENQAEVMASLVEKVKKIQIIPAGYWLVNQPLLLDNYLLESLPAKKLFCNELVRLEKEVTLESLKAGLESVIGKGLVLCPAGLRGVFSQICNPLENKVIFYDGDIWLISDALHLTASQLAAFSEKLTLLVEGSVEIDPDVPASLLEEKLARVHNLGSIRCTPDQMRVIRSRMGMNEGALNDSSLPNQETESEDANHTGNVNTLTL